MPHPPTGRRRRRPPPRGRLVSQPGAVLLASTSVAVFSKLLMHPAEALAPFSSGLLALLEVGPLLGCHSSDDITAVLLLLVLLNLDGRHCLGGVAQPQAVCPLGQLLQVGQLHTGQVHMDGPWQPHGEGSP